MGELNRGESWCGTGPLLWMKLGRCMLFLAHLLHVQASRSMLLLGDPSCSRVMECMLFVCICS